MTAAGDDARRLFTPRDGGEVRAYAASPGGDEVALLLAAPAGGGETASVRVLAPDGAEVHRVDKVESALTGDAARGSARARSLTWSPQGDQLLVTFNPGGLVGLRSDGAPVLLVDPAGAPEPAHAAWSPAGDAIAFVSPAGPGGGSPARTDLYVAPDGEPPLDPVPILATTGADRDVTTFAWLPDGRGILFAGAEAPGAATGGDLFVVSPTGRDLRLVASAGFAAPIAEVVHVAPSPDGRSVAYTIFLPTGGADDAGEGTLTFHSLWVRPLAGGPAVQLAVTPGDTVCDLWWTAGGLVVRVVPDAPPGLTRYEGGAFALHIIGRDTQPVELHAAVPVATPVATPAASPVASPAASPEAALPGGRRRV